jgi:uncharacterized RDD family membrane protein YckC
LAIHSIDMQQFKATENTGKRVLATLIDYVVIVAFAWWYISSFGEETEPGKYEVRGWGALVPTVFWFLFIVLPEGLTGQSLGHAITGLKIVDSSGNKPSFGQALVRRLFDLVDISCTMGLVAFIVVKSNQTRQRVGDLVAKTFVVEKSFQPAGEFEFENPAA